MKIIFRLCALLMLVSLVLLIQTSNYIAAIFAVVASLFAYAASELSDDDSGPYKGGGLQA